jgi:hypothetical protein
LKNLLLLTLSIFCQANLTSTQALAGAVSSTSSQDIVVPNLSTYQPASEVDVEIQLPKNFGHSSSLISSSQCEIKCNSPHAACSESARVLSIEEQIHKSISERDFNTVGKYIDDHCTKFDQGTGKLIVGKKAILEDLERQLDKAGRNSKTPLLSYTIDHPYAHVTGDNAVVTFTAFREFGGARPQKFESHCTDIFKREGDSWKKISYRSNWKEINL